MSTHKSRSQQRLRAQLGVRLRIPATHNQARPAVPVSPGSDDADDADDAEVSRTANESFFEPRTHKRHVVFSLDTPSPRLRFPTNPNATATVQVPRPAWRDQLQQPGAGVRPPGRNLTPYPSSPPSSPQSTLQSLQQRAHAAEKLAHRLRLERAQLEEQERAADERLEQLEEELSWLLRQVDEAERDQEDQEDAGVPVPVYGEVIVTSPSVYEWDFAGLGPGWGQEG
ncbi:uncharacterized protein HMPREF1541_04565 [Cyphellophora europaea CBS 101466]|uniref:Uncharacterized protein n=1 Tax=Cyphellophora europaea (strain CBS 101466) TaxID=1220924 RepID=W2RX59_CYPE1|nr:uncharacterized protein HMPREF1541_04565 [Cyphellophora europaea CBS 101466]ETN40289.1 hypothetical protein HMPREF1541_04565 [Cyphellophora europaea CBS 101466]